MEIATDFSLLVFVLSFFALSLSGGASFLRRQRWLDEDKREDFGVILAAFA